METLRTYLNKLTTDQQRDFAARCGTSIGYLRKAISVRPKKMDGALVTALWRESGHAISRSELRPDIWRPKVRNLREGER